MRLCHLLLTTALALAACGHKPSGDPSRAQGPDPQLDQPQTRTIPTVNVAKGEGWPHGKTPIPGEGLQINEFAGGLQHPRWLYVLPNGDVLAAESDSPGTDKTGGNLRGTIQKLLMKKAGSDSPSANRISLLRDADGDGIAEARTVLLTGLYSPFGMAFANGAVSYTHLTLPTN